MGKYGRFEQKTAKKKVLNPIWRGIGCLLMVIVPAISYGLAIFLIPIVIASGYVPLELLGRVRFPEWVFKAPILYNLALYFGGINDLLAKLIGYFIILVVLAGIISLTYILIYQVVGPARYSKTDEPPSKHKPKVYKR